MSATSEAVGQAIDLTILVILGDRVSAEKQREIRRVVEDVQAGKITEIEAYGRLRYKDGDALDQALDGMKAPAAPGLEQAGQG